MATNKARLINGKWYTDKENPLGISEPEKYVSTRPHFETQEEMTAAMKDPRYGTDEGYRQHVYQMIAASDGVALGVEQGPSQIDGGDQVEALHDWVRQAFSDPRYKTSALYRAQLMEAIRQDPTIDKVFVQPLHPMGGVARFQVEPTITGPMAPEKPKYNPDNVGDEGSDEE